MINRQKIRNLFSLFAGMNRYLCDVYQDFAYLSYAKDPDINGSKQVILEDIEGIQNQLTSLFQTVTIEDNFPLDTQGIDNAITDIRNELQKITTLEDIDKFVLYDNGELYENCLIDDLVGKLRLEISILFLEIQKIFFERTVYPFETEPRLLPSYDEVNSNPQSAIQQSFTIFEDYLRHKIGADVSVYGEDLINKAFGKEGELVYSDISAEQQGVRNLFSGTYATFRNPNMHRIIREDENRALAIISLIYLLFDLVNNSKRK